MRASYTQGIAAFCAFTSKTLVNSRSNKVVNIASTTMMKRKLWFIPGRWEASNPESEIPRCAITHLSLLLSHHTGMTTYSFSEALMAINASLSAGKSSFTAFQMIWPSTR
jgi:hypothetical protein